MPPVPCTTVVGANISIDFEDPVLGGIGIVDEFVVRLSFPGHALTFQSYLDLQDTGFLQTSLQDTDGDTVADQLTISLAQPTDLFAGPFGTAVFACTGVPVPAEFGCAAEGKVRRLDGSGVVDLPASCSL